MRRSRHLIALLLSLLCCTVILIQGGTAQEPETEIATDKPSWIRSVFTELASGKYPRIKAINYWHETWQNDFGPPSELRLDSSPESLNAYKEGLTQLNIVTTPVFTQTEEGYKLAPPASDGIYHSAFPDFGETEDQVTQERITEFEELVGTPITWVYFSNNWENKIEFPTDDVWTIHESGHVPYIRLMPWTDEVLYTTESNYTMERIINGVFDQALTQWAIQANSTPFPLIVEFGVEVNTNAFPWSGCYIGGGTTTEYGDPSYPDGPERFRDAYRHIIDLFRELNVQNITWVFHIDSDNTPNEWWNQARYYYPGDAYIDWIGVSIYGPQFWSDKWEWSQFPEMLQQSYEIMCNLSSTKPLAILEFGVDENGGTAWKVYSLYIGIPVGIGIGIIITMVLYFRRKRKQKQE